ncbi:RNase H domain-containing protein [Trichonephila clavipes]|nr:RNase H domain-containing protein [Trichonephila clavipes]
MGSRTRERPPTRWIDDVENDIKTLNIKSWQRVAAYRWNWRKRAVEAAKTSNRSELIAISDTLDHALNSYKDSIWILTDSRSSIQYLKNWPKIMDSTSLDILSKLVRLGQRKQVRLQWIPSHVGVSGNEAADELSGRGCDLPNPSSTVLTHTEIHSFQRNQMNLTWRNPPTHHWYAAKSPGLSIQCRSSRAHQTALARLRSGHLHSMTFVQGVKSFFTCPCSLLASPALLLDC